MSDSTHTLSSEFILPTNRGVGATAAELDPDAPCVYLVGNSLGALSTRSAALVKEELGAWGLVGVEGHFDHGHPHARPWTKIQDQCTPLLAALVGAREPEVACMGTLTANLHLMLTTFYKPSAARYKILCEAKAFPSDQYAFASQAALHGLDPADAVLELAPRAGEYFLREDDILRTIAAHGASIALVLLSGVQYYTGQLFPMAAITAAARGAGCVCGWDLAHAVGNVPLRLHEWGADFAVWCTYKYLNSGPGGIGGLFVHERWNGLQTPLAGWWGNPLETRFAMRPTFEAIAGAQGFQQSNPSVLAVAALLGSLQVFQAAGLMPAVRARSEALTGALWRLLTGLDGWYVPLADAAARTARPGFTIITTPAGAATEEERAAQRGAQLSLLFLPAGGEVMHQVSRKLGGFGVLGDTREPDVIRLAPAPLYNSLRDCERAAGYLKRALEEVTAEWESERKV
ncbi:hypothetical protein HWV62_28652 [Athelia sp. TMB]|nr:hypothetical protein HWV62_28652 [Athelia sp. TMB]